MKIGTKVEYRQHDKLIGTGEIVGIGTKNGMKVYDVTMSDGKYFWGYKDQFTPLKKKATKMDALIAELREYFEYDLDTLDHLNPILTKYENKQ